VGRNGVFEYLLFKNLWEATTHQVFAYKIGESGLSGADRNYIFKYLLVEMLLGRHRSTQFLHRTLENLGLRGWAGIIVLNIFYLK